LLEEFRAQLRDEALKAIQSAIFASKEVIARQTAKEMSEAHEAARQDSHALCGKRSSQDMVRAPGSICKVQGREVAQRLDALRPARSSACKANGRHTQLKRWTASYLAFANQIAPMLEVAKRFPSETGRRRNRFEEGIEAIFAGIEKPACLQHQRKFGKGPGRIGKNAAAQTAKANETLVQLYQNFEKTTKDNVESLLGSLGSQMAKILQKKPRRFPASFRKGSKAIPEVISSRSVNRLSEIPQNMPAHSRQ